jgi:hypothetical protein
MDGELAARSMTETFMIPVPEPGRGRPWHVVKDRSLSLLPVQDNGKEEDRCLICVLESRNLLSYALCGFGRHRSTIDLPLNLKYNIRNAFTPRQGHIVVCFDMGRLMAELGSTVFSEHFTAKT